MSSATVQDVINRIEILGEALDRVTKYTVESRDPVRLGFHDLVLLETLRGMSDRLHVTPEVAMLAIITADEHVSIAGKNTEIWSQFDDDTEDLVIRLALGWAADGSDDTDDDEDGGE